MSELSNQQAVSNVDQVLRLFDISDEGLRTIKSHIAKEFELGLSDEENATIKMLITYVRELSRGNESGSYLALDLGGTHFRVLLVNLDQGQAKVTTAVHDIPQVLLTTQDGQELFDYIALRLLEFVQKHKLKRKRISLGFTFSFPCKQYGLTQSVLVKWCKGFKVGGVVGTDVVKQLKDALKRQLAGLVEAYIDVVAVINDTTGTLVACANSNRDCRIGLIVGTGFNACYMERLDKCEKWPANYTTPKQVIVNCEWGAMGDNKDRRELDKYRNEFDAQVDAESVNPKNQTYEKMVSGMYIGELLRLAMLKLYHNKLLFAKMPENRQPTDTCSQDDPKSKSSTTTNEQRTKNSISTGSTGSNLTHPLPPSASSASSSGTTQLDSTSQVTTTSGHKLWIKDILNGKHLSMLAKDELSGSFEEATKIMRKLNITQFSQKDLALVVQLGSRIMQRSANLVAAGISALLERIKRPYTVIGYDGSVVKNHPYFLKKLTEKCALLTPKEYRFEFMLSSDGSGIGAAVVAAALHKERRPLYIVKQGKLYEMHFINTQQQHQSSTDIAAKSITSKR